MRTRLIVPCLLLTAAAVLPARNAEAQVVGGYAVPAPGFVMGAPVVPAPMVVAPGASYSRGYRAWGRRPGYGPNRYGYRNGGYRAPGWGPRYGYRGWGRRW
jgi:hypothetical protein